MANAGVWLPGTNSRIDRLTVTRNGGDGIVVGPAGLVSNNIVSHNNGIGIANLGSSVYDGIALAVGNVVQGNAKEGVWAGIMRDNFLWANNPGGRQAVSFDAGGNLCDYFSC